MKTESKIIRNGKVFEVCNSEGEIVYSSTDFSQAQHYFMKFLAEDVSSSDYEYAGYVGKNAIRGRAGEDRLDVAAEVQRYNRLREKLANKPW